MWVRGLKLMVFVLIVRKHLSHPMWVRGLKHIKITMKTKIYLSHPMWVRGLKLCVSLIQRRRL